MWSAVSPYCKGVPKLEHISKVTEKLPVHLESQQESLHLLVLTEQFDQHHVMLLNVGQSLHPVPTLSIPSEYGYVDLLT